MSGVHKHLSQAAITLLLTLSVQAQTKIFSANSYGAKPDGTTLNSAFIQKAIDAAAPVHGTVTFAPGTYLTGSLFLKSGVTFEVPEGVTLIGSQHLEDYPELPTRIAGIEMTWPAALINVRDQHDVTLTGKGTIDGDGPIWWKSYWDLRAQYEPKGLRWASDYDARRPRLILLQDSSDVHLGGGITLKRSGFWTVQVLYSHNIAIDGVVIRKNEGGRGPSTDGIDIDSMTNATVNDCFIEDGDDGVAIKTNKSGASNITISNSTFHGTHGMSIGSQTFDGVTNVLWENNTVFGSDQFGNVSTNNNGINIKSDPSCGGKVQQVTYNHTCMTGVKHLLTFNTSFGSCSGKSGTPVYTDIVVNGVLSTHSQSGAFSEFDGFNSSNLLAVTLENVDLDVTATKTTQNASIGIFNSNVKPSGTDVTTFSVAGSGSIPSCTF